MRAPVSADEQELRRVLAYHGFTTAAAQLNPQRDRLDAALLLRKWDDYPTCMARYPAHLRRKDK